MAFTINYDPSTNPGGSISLNPVTWNKGQPKPHIAYKGMILIASHDELEYIKHKFVGIPLVVDNEICVWRGDIAAFIWENL